MGKFFGAYTQMILTHLGFKKKSLKNILKIVAVLVYLDTSYFCYWTAFCRTHPTSGDQNRVQNFLKTFLIFFRNAQCLRIFWVYAQKKFPIANFGYGVIYEKVPFFTDFLVRTPQKSIGLVYP